MGSGDARFVNFSVLFMSIFIWNIPSDKERFYVFSKHKSLYKSINKELKNWLTENWDKWEEEKEDWFTAKMIGRIPEELLPEKFTIKLGVDARGRRKSINSMIKAEEKELLGSGSESNEVRSESEKELVGKRGIGARVAPG